MKLFQNIRPLHCSAATIIRLLDQFATLGDPDIELLIEYNGKRHRVGAASGANNKAKCVDTVFYIDRQKYASIGAFVSGATLDGTKFAYIRDVSVLRDRDFGDPREDTLLAENEIKERESTIEKL